MVAAAILQPLRDEHACIEGHEKHRPAPEACLEQVFAQQATDHQGQKYVDQLEKTHRLQGSQPDQGREAKHEHGHCQLKDPVKKDSQRKARQQRLAAFSG